MYYRFGDQDTTFHFFSCTLIGMLEALESYYLSLDRSSQFSRSVVDSLVHDVMLLVEEAEKLKEVRLGLLRVSEHSYIRPFEEKRIFGLLCLIV